MQRLALGSGCAPTHKRGAQVEGGGGRPSKARCGQFPLAGIPIPALDETKHFNLIGTTGNGKTTAVRKLRGAIFFGQRVAAGIGGFAWICV